MRVGEEVEVGMGVRVGVREGVSVAVFVRVGVRDKAATASCASNVCAARVARALRFAVGDGISVWVTVGVAVGGRVGVGEEVSVAVAGGTDVMVAGSVVICSNVSDDEVLTGAGVRVRASRLVKNEVGVAVERESEEDGNA